MSLPLKNMVLPLKNLVKIKTSPPKNSIFFYSTPKEILSFYNLPLENSMVPQPGRYGLTVPDPDLQIRGERGGGSHPDPEIKGGLASKKMSLPLKNMVLPLKNMVLPLKNLVKIKTSPPKNSIFFYP